MLTVEDGTGLTDADSLVTVDYVRDFAARRGATVSSDDDTLEPQIRIAHDYLAAVEDRLQGERTNPEQSLPFPRDGVTLFNQALAKDVIPALVKQAIAQLVIEGLTTDIMPTSDGRQVTQETVGPISTSYAPGSGNAPTFPRVDTFLQPFLTESGGMPLSLIRV